MEAVTSETQNNSELGNKKPKTKFNLKKLRISLKYRPEILKLVLKMRQCIKNKNVLLKKFKKQLKVMESSKEKESDSKTKPLSKPKLKNASSQTEILLPTDVKEAQVNKEKVKTPEGKDSEAGWSSNGNEEGKSIADQVKEAAQSALQQTGMVYVESAGMYYDYKTGYYYNTELGLYYHTDTGCYYYYNEDKKEFAFHSYPDRNAAATNPSLEAHEKRKARKLKKVQKTEEDIDSLTKNLSQVSLRGQTALDSVAKHHPPCMRIIVRETKLPKLKVGSLFVITKDGGTIGREGDHHTVLIRDTNVSRNHLDIRYDMDKRMYMVTDLGSKNGTMLNGIQMSGSQVVSPPMEVLHGSTIQLGETKLLCHIHAGNDTCGHCEPGLIMETQEKEKAAYTRTCDVKKQYDLELARLKNKYRPEPLMIEEGTYNDRAKARREAVGSSHHSEKTVTADVDTHITTENKGFKLLEKMGWSKGEGLGKDNQGGTEPVPLLSNEGKAGLGTPGSVGAPSAPAPKPRSTLGPATLRLAARSKLLKPPAKAFQDMEDEEEE
ncbi:angiogenic factor with G patch and FHA domains 1-like isoform X2 [Pectinophora gossypiella]|uniref:angiogenic factor with G patch and FHA domains 1-like isoform X2 n=1 Tax=Pectinophora gossypiella TaxID=13191 RepID=UPI00214E265E|nr:angiogenic factor with G patch and FHA domains 1-like isoform X2 [Pectinophora gossypiella]